jgi:hypothetical protein
VDSPHIVNATLLINSEFAPGILVTRPQTTLPTVLVMPITETNNIACLEDMPDSTALSENENGLE